MCYRFFVYKYFLIIMLIYRFFRLNKPLRTRQIQKINPQIYSKHENEISYKRAHENKFLPFSLYFSSIFISSYEQVPKCSPVTL